MIFYSQAPFEPFLSPALVDIASQAHPILSKLVLIIVIAHVSAVFWHQFVMKEPLIQGMFHGLKPGFGHSIGRPDPFSKLVLLRGFIFFTVHWRGTRHSRILPWMVTPKNSRE